MKIRWSTLLLVPIFLLFGAIAISGCGGSTTGTGGVTVVGKVLSAKGQPVSNVNVTVSNTGDSTSTDNNGDFSVKTESLDRYDFLFETDTRTITGSITSVPSNATQVKAVFTIKEDSDEADETEVEFKEHDSRSSTPTPRPTRTGSRPSSGSSSSSSEAFSSRTQNPSSDDQHSSSSSSFSSASSETSNVSPTPSPTPNRTPESKEKEETGRILSINGNDLVVNSTTYQVTSQTKINIEGKTNAKIADLTTGDRVHIQGISTGGVYYASEIELVQ